MSVIASRFIYATIKEQSCGPTNFVPKNQEEVAFFVISQFPTESNPEDLCEQLCSERDV